LSIGVATQGRTAAIFNCADPAFNANWYTGPIAGHPFELDLTEAGIDQIPGHENFSWGKIISSQFSAFGCFVTNHIIGVTQVSNTVVITNFGTNNAVDCGRNFTLIEP
jgi:hypothetical protein